MDMVCSDLGTKCASIQVHISLLYIHVCILCVIHIIIMYMMCVYICMYMYIPPLSAPVVVAVVYA